MLQVCAPEPLEVAVLGHDLNQVLQLRIALPIVAGLVGVGNDQHVCRIGAGAKARIEFGERGKKLGRYAIAVFRSPKQHIVMAPSCTSR